jgi:aminomethyltransferase
VLYGHELDEQTSPMEARISYAVKFKVDPHYIGYDAVKQQKEKGVTKTRVGLVMVERGVPREHYPVLLGGKQIGEVTSGGMSPVLDNGIGLAYVRPGLVDTGSIVEVDIKGRVRKAKVVEWPFYDTSAYGENRTQ